MTTEPAFLGRGWAFPPRFAAGGGDVVMVAGEEDVHECLQILLGTRPGERVMQPDFGCDLSRVQFEEIDFGFVNKVKQLVSDAVLLHEPRVSLDRVDVSRDAANAGTVLISIEYTVRSSNSRFNMVYPFYVDDARAPGT